MSPKYKVTYLTEKIKKSILGDFTNRLNANELDPGIVTELLRVNDVKGVCTLESCEGHSDGNGYVTLRFSKEMHFAAVKNISNMFKVLKLRRLSIDYDFIRSYDRITRPSKVAIYPRVFLSYKGRAKKFYKELIKLLKELEREIND